MENERRDGEDRRSGSDRRADAQNQGGFFQRRIVAPIRTLLKQGITPEKLSLCLALGAGIGIFPILGTTTAICAIVALALRLNLVAIQIANYAVYPLQILLIIPFMRLGERILGAQPMPLSASEIVERFSGGLVQGITTLAGALMHAVLGWGVTMPIVIAILTFALRPLMRRIAAAHAARAGRAAS